MDVRRSLLAPDPQPRRFAVGLIVTLLGSLLLWWPAWNAWFGADDFLWLEQDRWSDLQSALFGAWGHGAAWRPLARLSFFIDARLFGDSAIGWHTTNLALHGLCTALLALLVRRLTRDEPVALITAAIFTLQPILHTNVIWISGRTYLIATAAGLAALLAVDAWMRRRRRHSLLFVALATAAACLAYEPAVVLLPLAGFVVLCARTRAPEAGGGRAAIQVLTLVAGVEAVYWLLRYFALAGASLYPMPAIERGDPSLFGAMILIGLYRTMTPFVPVGLVLVIFAALSVRWRDARALCLAVLSVVVCLIPFAVIDAFVPRFAYAATMAVSLLMALAWRIGLRVPKVGSLLATGLVLWLVFATASTTRGHTRAWGKAADLGHDFIAALQGEIAALPADAALLVLEPPRSYNGAFLFFTHFDSALRVFAPPFRGLVLDDAVLRPVPSDEAELERRLRDARERGVQSLHCEKFDAAVESRQPRRLAVSAIDCGATALIFDPRTRELRRQTRESVAAWVRVWEARHSAGWIRRVGEDRRR